MAKKYKQKIVQMISETSGSDNLYCQIAGSVQNENGDKLMKPLHSFIFFNTQNGGNIVFEKTSYNKYFDTTYLGNIYYKYNMQLEIDFSPADNPFPDEIKNTTLQLYITAMPYDEFKDKAHKMFPDKN